MKLEYGNEYILSNSMFFILSFLSSNSIIIFVCPMLFLIYNLHESWMWRAPFKLLLVWTLAIYSTSNSGAKQLSKNKIKNNPEPNK